MDLVKEALIHQIHTRFEIPALLNFKALNKFEEKGAIWVSKMRNKIGFRVSKARTRFNCLADPSFVFLCFLV
ncbi:hypothetical protein COLO4_35431 [Corchorus olitorius]|uniref:Uncharacterized protein n=1 Tax=Corchorus olitorius TaxID=93759 RepID=A0A1R3GGV8_9ROSI|nr:hypothetical protein COLO4_35431 [Corchorus olitorius]